MVGREYLDHYRAFLDAQNITINNDTTRYLAIQNALDYGNFTEVHSYGFGIDSGLMGTGIYSYGDLAANYGGLLFWLRLTSKNVDSSPQGFLDNFPYTDGAKGTSPHFECDSTTNTWKLQREIKMQDYINAAWDETQNMNMFLTQKMTDGFNEYLKFLHGKGQVPRDTIPFEVDSCKNLKGYAPVEHMRNFLSPTCFVLTQ